MVDHQVDLVAIGDSLTYGFPFSPKASWVEALNDLFPRGVVNQGSCGDTTSGMLSRFREDVLSYQPEYVIIMGGTNDILCVHPIPDILYNLKKMIERAQKEDIVPVIGIPIPCDDLKIELRLNEYRSKLYEVCDMMDLRILDFYQVMINTQGQGIIPRYYSDGIHPSLSGYKVMSQLARKTFIDLLSL